MVKLKSLHLCKFQGCHLSHRKRGLASPAQGRGNAISRTLAARPHLCPGLCLSPSAAAARRTCSSRRQSRDGRAPAPGRAMMRPGRGERYGTVVVTWVESWGVEGLLQPTPKPTAPPLPRSRRRECGRIPPPALAPAPAPAGRRAKLSPRPAPGRGGSGVTSSRPSTPFLPVFLVTVDSSLLFPNPLSLYRERSHSEV